MAERKPGPVKPPTIDLTARPVEAASRRHLPEPETAAPRDELPPEPTPVPPSDQASAPPPPPPDMPPKPERADESPLPPPPPAPPPATSSRSGQPWETIAIAAVAGALLGVALIYVLASFVPLPSAGPGFSDPTQALADTDRRLDNLEASGAAIADQATRTQVSLDATITQLDTGLADLRKALDDAVAREPAATDLSGIETRLQALSSRLDAVAAGASSADSEALAQSLTALQTAVTGLTGRLDALEQARGTTESTVASLKTTIDELQGRLTAEAEAGKQATATINRAAQAEALGAAITAGKPFATELDAVVQASPEAVVPPDLQARAAAGLPNADALAQRFAERVPDMLAAHPVPQGAAWQDQAMDWIKGMLAIRPAEESSGDAPTAVMSRLEAAMARHDFNAAAELFAQLPPEMRAAAGDVATDVAAIASAEALLAQLRATPTAGAAQ